MPEDLAVINGEVAMAYAGDTPWHRLGTRMSSTADVAEALAAAHLNWKVVLKPLFYLDEAQEPVYVKSRRAVVRDVDEMLLGTVGSDYAPVQNADAFGILADACQHFGVTIESAGALGAGAQTWMLAKLPHSIEPVEGDEVRGYFLVRNGHDGSVAYEAIPTPIRVVCQNTLNAALDHAGGAHTLRGRAFRLKHTTNVNQRLEQVKNLVNNLIKAMNQTGETFATLARAKMTPQQVAEYIKSVLPDQGDKPSAKLQQKRKDIGMLVWAAPGAELAGADGDGATAWAAYNAVCAYIDHVRPAQAKNAKAILRADQSALFGSGLALKILALQRAQEFAYAVVRR
jgi:phage/plasmid-like protein (TIGR03299 family)